MGRRQGFGPAQGGLHAEGQAAHQVVSHRPHPAVPEVDDGLALEHGHPSVGLLEPDMVLAEGVGDQVPEGEARVLAQTHLEGPGGQVALSLAEEGLGAGLVRGCGQQAGGEEEGDHGAHGTSR